MGKILRTSLDFYFRRNRRFCDLRQIYANLRGFRLLHLKISKKFRKGRIERTSYRIEVEGCCYISIYFLKYRLSVGIFYRIFKWTIFVNEKHALLQGQKTHIGTSILTKCLLLQESRRIELAKAAIKLWGY